MAARWLAAMSLLVVAVVGCSDDGPSVVDDLPQLVVDQDSYYGFVIGSADDTVGLRIGWRDPGPTDGFPTVVFPSDEWEGELWTGTDLFDTWGCDDCPPSKTVVDERFELVAGELTIEPVDFDPRQLPVADEFQECGQARAELTGGVAVAADGSSVELDDVSFFNSRFGCGNP